MKVHFRSKRGDKEDMDCDSISEGEHGLFLYEGSAQAGENIGYVPYEQLDHVAPSP